MGFTGGATATAGSASMDVPPKITRGGNAFQQLPGFAKSSDTYGLDPVAKPSPPDAGNSVVLAPYIVLDAVVGAKSHVFIVLMIDHAISRRLTNRDGFYKEQRDGNYQKIEVICV